jgi:hypothetical protein
MATIAKAGSTSGSRLSTAISRNRRPSHGRVTGMIWSRACPIDRLFGPVYLFFFF